MKRSRPAQRSDSAVASAQSAQVEEHEAAFEVPEEYLSVPKEKSKLRFVLTLVLVLFLLIVFVAPGALTGLAGGSGPVENVYLSWTLPNGELVEMTGNEFYSERRIFATAFNISPFAGLALGVDGEPDEHEMARILVLERLAVEAGIEISRKELGQHIKEVNELRGLSRDVYKQFVDQYGVEVIEGTIQRALRVSRFLQMVGHAGALADPDKLEELWNNDHEECAFDYMSVTIADMKGEARKVLPDDEELTAWFDDQPETERDKLKKPERRKLEFVYFSNLEETPATALLEEYPDESERSPEELSEEYYNRVYFTRFTRPAEDLPEDAVPTAQERYLSQDETKEQTTAEAPIYFAMQAWLSDLQGRQAAEETIDLAAEAASLGLAHTAIDWKTREELPEAPFFAEDESTAVVENYSFQAPAGGFGWGLATTKKSLVISLTTEVEESALPPFAEIRPEIAEQWVEPKAEELATERLQAVWDGFEEFTKEEEENAFSQPEGPFRRATGEAFTASVEVDGLSFGQRDYFDKGGRINDDPDWEAAPNRFIATNKDYNAMDVDEVARPRTARDKSAVYLVRVVGKRPVSLDLMSPRQYESYKTRASSAALGEVSTTLDYETLAAQYNVRLISDEDRDERGEGTETP